VGNERAVGAMAGIAVVVRRLKWLKGTGRTGDDDRTVEFEM
jgi:hypothetical protein